MRTLLTLVFTLIVITGTAWAWDEEFYDFQHITADGLGSAMTLSTLPESPSAFLYNPAAMPGSLLPRISHNHSARHFPAEDGKREMDQLDNDYESAVFPLPLGSVGWGFTLVDEHGYDYTNHPKGEFPYPRERVKGDETCLAYSLGCYPVSAGTSLREFRREHYPATRPAFFTPGRSAPLFADSLVNGEDHSLGILAGLPWIRYALVRRQLDARKLQLPVGSQLVSRQKERRQGWRFNPVAWVSISGEQAELTKWSFAAEGTRPEPEAEVSHGRSITVRPLAFLEVSYGDVDGKRAWGCKLVLPALTVKYTEIQGFLGKVVGGTERFFSDMHYYGFDITLW